MTTKFAEFGKESQIFEPVIFINPQNIYIKDHVRISEFCWIHGGEQTVIGNFVHLTAHVSLNGGGKCIIEDFVNVSSGTRLVSGTENPDGSGLIGPMVPLDLRAVTRSFIHIKKHAFIGSNAVILPGVTIGEGAVVGAGAVVTKNVEPWTYVAGIPAKPMMITPKDMVDTGFDTLKIRPKSIVKKFEKECYERTGTTPYIWKK